MSEPSKEACDEARRLATGMLESFMTGNRDDPERDIAAAIQRHLDATAKAEAERDAWLKTAQENGTWCTEWRHRAEKAEARVMELRARGTELVLENRQLKARLSRYEDKC